MYSGDMPHGMHPLNKRPECYRGALEEGIMTHGQF